MPINNKRHNYINMGKNNFEYLENLFVIKFWSNIWFFNKYIMIKDLKQL